MKSIEEIKEIIIKHRKEVKEEYGVKEIGIFGSYLRGEQKKKSDIDILIEFEEAPGLFKFIELEDYLTEVLGVKVDLVMKSVLKPAIGKHVLEEVLYL